MALQDLCNVNQQLQQEAGRIGDMVAAKLIDTNLWNRLITQEAFPEGMGSTINTLIQQRVVAPNVSSTAWTDVGTNTGTGTSCVPTPQQIDFARDLYSYNLQQAAIRSPGFCVNDIRTAWSAEQQLNAEYKALKDNTDFFWSNRYRDEFFRLSGHKIVVDSTSVYSFSETGVNQALPASRALYALDQGMLDTWYLDLNRDSAEGYYATVDGMPQYALIVSPETSNYLKKQNADIRQDLRFSSEVDALIKPFGVGWSYSGFIHLIDQQAPRFNFTGGQYVRVPYYTTAASYVGNRAVVNPAYRTAQYEMTFIYNTNVYISRVPNSITSPGGNTKFDPQNYRGEFHWLNIPDINCNPLGNQGFFYAQFMQGSEPNRPEWGYSIVHLRCAPATQYRVCATS